MAKIFIFSLHWGAFVKDNFFGFTKTGDSMSKNALNSGMLLAKIFF